MALVTRHFDVSPATYVLAFLLVIANLCMSLFSKLSKFLAARSKPGSQITLLARMALLNIYDTLIAFRLVAALATCTIAFVVDHRTVQADWQTGKLDSSAEVVVFSLMGAMSLYSAAYPPIIYAFHTRKFGKRQVMVLLGLFAGSFVLVWATLVALCGYEDAPMGMNCKKASVNGIQDVILFIGFFEILGKLVTGFGAVITLFVVVCYIRKRVYPESKMPSRNPKLVQRAALLTMAWGLVLGIPTFVKGSYDFWVEMAITEAFMVVDNVIIYISLWDDSNSWSLLTLVLEPDEHAVTVSESLARLQGTQPLRTSSLPAHIRFSELEVSMNPLGQGSTATVYRGTFANTYVAVKAICLASMGEPEIHEHCYEMLVAKVLGRHPSIVEFHGFSVNPPYLYLTMELCTVGELGKLLHDSEAIGQCRQRHPELFMLARRVQHGRHEGISADWEVWALNVGVRLQLLAGLSDAVKFIHSRNTIHRDLKSDNVMVTIDDSHETGVRSKLMDWGVAITMAEVEKERKLNEAKIEAGTFRLKGTFHWLSPEVIYVRHIPEANKCPIYSSKSDVYALGMVAFECIERRRPDHVTLRQKLDPDFVYPAIIDRDSLGLDPGVLQNAWAYHPKLRCNATALYAAICQAALHHAEEMKKTRGTCDSDRDFRGSLARSDSCLSSGDVTVDLNSLATLRLSLQDLDSAGTHTRWAAGFSEASDDRRPSVRINRAGTAPPGLPTSSNKEASIVL